jgi:hypothetical protein
MNDHAEYASAELTRRERELALSSQIHRVLGHTLNDTTPEIRRVMGEVLRSLVRLEEVSGKALIRTMQMSAMTEALEQRVEAIDSKLLGVLSNLSAVWNTLSSGLRQLASYSFVTTTVALVCVLVGRGWKNATRIMFWAGK